MMKKKLGFLLLILGVLVLTYPHIAELINNHNLSRQSNDYLSKYEEPGYDSGQKLEEIRKCNDRLYSLANDFQDPFVDINNEGVTNCDLISDSEIFAVLEIPKLDLMLPIYLGASENNLSRGVSQVEGSSLPAGGENTHSLLAGHRGMATKEMFRHLDRLDLGDKFHIHLFDESLTYEINDTEVVYPWETDHLGIQDGKDLVTLFTCHPYRSNDQRLLVWGERYTGN
ncbi:class C sortase [Salipaludibacillus aurantiacus]|uniref:Sortase A n=1 Tax=Salipaludibacillus aurantiacus TaxID=1601833 RepID=A0A1H9UG68_9BACI|nr:class C sortase [Salipaludibacillus aurantiacus]SES08436.1 sortase A [Salipaludibacillus aurantiacus]